MVQGTVTQLGVTQTVVDITSNVEKFIMDQTNAMGSRTFGLHYALGFVPSMFNFSTVSVPSLKS